MPKFGVFGIRVTSSSTLEPPAFSPERRATSTKLAWESLEHFGLGASKIFSKSKRGEKIFFSFLGPNLMPDLENSYPSPPSPSQRGGGTSKIFFSFLGQISMSDRKNYAVFVSLPSFSTSKKFFFISQPEFDV